MDSYTPLNQESIFSFVEQDNHWMNMEVEFKQFTVSDSTQNSYKNLYISFWDELNINKMGFKKHLFDLIYLFLNSNLVGFLLKTTCV
jgi:hypothetical protein